MPEYIDLEKRGRYNTSNKLNELTGKEWIIFSKSFKRIKVPSLLAFYEEVVKQLILFFTKSGEKVLDLLSNNDIVKRVGTQLNRKVISVKVRKQFYSGDFNCIDISKIPKVQYMISAPFHLRSFDSSFTLEDFCDDYNLLVDNLTKFCK